MRGFQSSVSGVLSLSSFSHVAALASLGMRQSPRGDSAPPETIFGPFGTALRLYWLAKKRLMKTVSHFFKVA